jgi:hypothetical protein
MTNILNDVEPLHAARSGQLPDLGSSVFTALRRTDRYSDFALQPLPLSYPPNGDTPRHRSIENPRTDTSP